MEYISPYSKQQSTILDHYVTNNNILYGGTVFCEHDNGNFYSFTTPKTIIDKEKGIFNEDFLLYQGFLKLDKLRRLSEEVQFNFFATLTVSDLITDKDRANKLLQETLKKITDKYNTTFNLNQLSHLYGNSAEEVREANIKAYSEKEANLWIYREIKRFSFYKIADKHGKYFNKIKNKRKRKYFEIKFQKTEGIQEEINSYYEEIKEAEFIKRKNKPSYKDKLEVSEYKIRKQLEEPLYYFWVKEFTKQGQPHKHIILNKFIPNSLITECVELGINDITDNKFFYDGIVKDKRYNHLFIKEMSLLDKYNKIDDSFGSLFNKSSFSGSVVNYVSKYMGKDNINTYKLKHKYDIKAQLSRFSSTVTRDFKHIFEKEYTGLKKIGHTKRLMCKPMEEYKPIDESENNKFVEFNRHLKNAGFFDLHVNEPYLNIYNKYHEYIKFLDIDYKDLEETEFLEDFDLEDQNLHEQTNKLIIADCLDYIKNNNKLRHYSFNSKIIQQLNTSKSLNIEKKESINSILQNPLSLINGFAGTGKSHLITHLNYLKETAQIVYLTAKNKPKLSIIEKLQDLGFKESDYYVSTVSKYLEKKGKNYFINASNCRKSTDKSVFLIIDEIGQINYNELSSLFAGVHLDSIINIVFAGDLNQDKSFIGNSLIVDLKELDYINTINLSEQMRQENPETADIVNSFKDYCEFKGIEDIFDFYEDKEKTKEIIKQMITDDYQLLTNSVKLKKYLNSLALEMFKDVPLIADENFKLNVNTRIVNGQTFKQIKKYDNYATLEDLETKERYDINNYFYYKSFSPAFALTVDKVQGLGFDNVAVFFDTYSDKLLTKTKYYTALSRAKKKLKVFLSSDDVKAKILSSEQINNDLFKLSKSKEVFNILKEFKTLEDNVTNSDKIKLFIRNIKNLYISPC